MISYQVEDITLPISNPNKQLIAKEYFEEKMACFHPNIIMIEENAITKVNGKRGAKTTFISYTSDNYEYYLKEAKTLKENAHKLQGHIKKIILAPCGVCQGCRITRRQEWATRIWLESKYYQNNYFLTLTYNDENILIPEYWTDSQTGEIYNNPGTWTGTLSKEHITKFLDALRHHFIRKYNHTGMKYFICGEYASRPHYHAILLNCPELPLKAIGKNKLRQTYFTNEPIENMWGKGFITIGKVTQDSINYVAGYVNKKMYGKKALEAYDKLGKLPEFAMMSRSLGLKYYEEHKDEIYKNDEIINGKGKSIKPPLYFDRKFKEENPRLYNQIKMKRENITAYETEKKMKQTSNNLHDAYIVGESYAEDRQRRYNRGRI